jgi:uncharacterized protein YndB with AHSA1/START domain
MRRQIDMERTFRAPIEDVWALWTTADGIESWWGPDGFTTKVLALDLRPGGELRYQMIATGAPQVEFMKRANMPLVQECRLTYQEIIAPRRLAYVHLADFVPGVTPYDVTHVVEFQAKGAEVTMKLSIQAMHDEEWTKRAVMGWTQELDRLARVLEERT